MIFKLLTEHHLEFLSLKGDCIGSSESTLVKMPHCWKSHAMTHYYFLLYHTMYGNGLVAAGCDIFRKCCSFLYN